MAIGDVVSAHDAIATTAYLDVVPSGSVEWVIHNIYHEAAITLQWYDGTDSIDFDAATGAGWYANLQIHVKNALRLRIRNDDAGTKDIGYDGMVTKA